MKIEHIKKKDDFERILTDGQKVQGEDLSMFFIREKDHAGKIGVIVSKKNAPKATRRNYIKRVIYNFFTRERENFSQGFSAVARFKGERTISQTKRERSRKIKQDLTKLAKYLRENK